MNLQGNQKGENSVKWKDHFIPSSQAQTEITFPEVFILAKDWDTKSSCNFSLDVQLLQLQKNVEAEVKCLILPKDSSLGTEPG